MFSTRKPATIYDRKSPVKAVKFNHTIEIPEKRTSSMNSKSARKKKMKRSISQPKYATVGIQTEEHTKSRSKSRDPKTIDGMTVEDFLN